MSESRPEPSLALTFVIFCGHLARITLTITALLHVMGVRAPVRSLMACQNTYTGITTYDMPRLLLAVTHTAPDSGVAAFAPLILIMESCKIDG